MVSVVTPGEELELGREVYLARQATEAIFQILPGVFPCHPFK